MKPAKTRFTAKGLIREVRSGETYEYFRLGNILLPRPVFAAADPHLNTHALKLDSFSISLQTAGQLMK